MSRSATLPLAVGAPEPLTLLHRCLMQAEEEAEALIRDVGALGALGAPRGRIVGSAPVSPLKEHRASGREVQELRDQLQRACRERDEAHREVARLGERLEEAAAAMMRRQLEEEAERRRALRTRLVEQLHHQDFLLAAARRNVLTELQVALRDKVHLQLELEKLTDEHSRLLQSSSAALEGAATQRELLERTIERLRGEPRPQGAPLREDLQGSRTQFLNLCLGLLSIFWVFFYSSVARHGSGAVSPPARQTSCHCGPQ